MIKFTVTADDGRRVLALGLTDENLRLLREQRPITIRLDDLGLDWIGDLLIFWGRTEYEITESIASLIGPETKIQ